MALWVVEVRSPEHSQVNIHVINKIVCEIIAYLMFMISVYIERMIPFDAETVAGGSLGRRSMYGRGTIARAFSSEYPFYQ